MDNSLKFAVIAGFMGVVSMPSAVAAQPNNAASSSQAVSRKGKREGDPYRMSWMVSHGVGIDIQDAGNPLLSSKFAIKGAPLTSSRVPLFGRPSVDLYGMIESPAKDFVSDTRESLLARINLLTADIDVDHPAGHNENFLDYIQFSPELRVLRPKLSDPQIYGGGSIGQGVFSPNYNLDALAWFGFQVGPDYLVSAGGDFILEVDKHLSLGANLEIIFPGVKDKFAGYFAIGPKFLLNSSNPSNHGFMINPYFMLNGFSVSKADVRNREVPPLQVGLNLGYYGYELFRGKR